MIDRVGKQLSPEVAVRVVLDHGEEMVQVSVVPGSLLIEANVPTIG